MSHSQNKEVLLGVTGSIAAYKACELASMLVKSGLRVTAALTSHATQLIGPASLEAITGQRAITGLFDPIANADIEHVAVAQRVQLVIIAPATANILAKAAHGIADDWLSTALLATRAPVLFAPAMNTLMYAHPATQANIALLRERKCRFVGPDSGRLACGTQGPGRMAEPADIMDAALPLLDERNDLDGLHVLITSGGVREPIDPVRFIGNRSSGRMGRALAWEALLRKARVTVVSGPSEVAMPAAVEVLTVETTAQMLNAVIEAAPESDIIIGAAAVADFRVENQDNAKMKRGGPPPELRLLENPDIIAAVVSSRRPGQVIAGFAAETQDLLKNAQAKLAQKGLDIIVANVVGRPDSGFGSDMLNAAIMDASGEIVNLGEATKASVAEALFDQISYRFHPAC